MNKLLSTTVGKLLGEVAQRYPNEQAVCYDDRDYTRTWSEFNSECDRAARGLMAMGVKKGDHVAVWATNIPQWMITLFAACKIGAVLVTVNTSYKIFEIEYLLRQSDTKVLVMNGGYKDSDYVGIINELCPQIRDSDKSLLDLPQLPKLKQIIFVGDETPDGMYNFDELFALADNVPDAEYQTLTDSLDGDEVVNMQYTSGTTGFPKGVMLTHNNIVNNGLAIGDCMKLTQRDKLCIPVPFFHCFGLVLGIMACITHSTAMVPVEYYRPVPVMKAVMDQGCTGVHGVPTMFIAMLEHKEFPNFTFPKLRTGIMAGSPCPIKTMQQVIAEMGARDITITYGQTEASPACTMTTTDDSIEQRVNTVGRAMPFVEAKIIDPATGETLPPGQPGEFCARGYNLMKGYYNMPEATAGAIDGDGWLHTGDIAVCDGQGYYKITGRIKDMIIRGGENIYPKEIEDFLYHHPDISDVQVIGVPSKQYGEEIMACVVLKEGRTLTGDNVKEHVRSHMARHKTPSYVRFMDSFPMTASGKIQKYKLREQAIELLKLQDAAAIETA